MKDFKNILVVRTDRIGDVILTTPCFKALRRAYPRAKISVLLSPLTYELLQGNPYLDEILVDDRADEHRGFSGFLKLAQELRRRRFDAAIIFHTKKRTNALCFFAGIPFRAGFKNNKFGFLLNFPLKDERHFGLKQEAEYCMDVLKALGVPETDMEVYVSKNKAAEDWAEHFWAGSGITKDMKRIVIHPGASDPAKCWASEIFIQLINQLGMKAPCKIILVGGSNTKEVSRQIAAGCPFPLIDLTGETSLSQLASLFRRSDILISNDSGPVHLAAAVGTPVVSIFTRNLPGINPDRWRPLSRNVKVVSVLPQEEVLIRHQGQPSGVITVREVFEAVDAIFKL